jgi:polar amino acid transport system substrate-binding protein
MRRLLPLHDRTPFAALIVLLLGALLSGCQPLQPPSEQPAAAAGTDGVSAAAAVPLTTPDTATDWPRIEEAGRLVVGTAADYPPFEYYGESFALDGYDPALLEAIGENLGLEVVFQDIAFEGLPDALALGQIDVAAAALTVTPARAAVVDFSQPYFETTEGVLAAREAGHQIDSLADFEGKRIGAERGSVYESLLRNQLVETGMLPAENLLLYTTLDAAAADLSEGRIDLLVTDLPAAERLARSAGFTLAESGLVAQQYALAVRKGSDELRGKLDAALAALASDGTLARLASEELGLAPDQITPPGELKAEDASEAGGSQPPCRNGLAWVEDVTLPDLDMTAPALMVPGQSFSKTWRVRNIGTCAWDEGYTLIFAHGSAPGAAMGGEAVAVSRVVEPGQTYDLEAPLVAPITAGTYQGAWQMQAPGGRSFGERLRVGIQVAGAPTPTPAPTQTPSPGISFSANAERVLQGNPVQFTWDVQDADEVYFYRAGQDWTGRSVEAQGSAADIPAATTTYNLRVVRGGQEEIRELTVYVEPNEGLPQIPHFTLSPSGELPLGQCVTLAWQVTGDVSGVALFRNKEPLWDDAPVEGTFEDCPEALGTYEYAVGAQGPAGLNYAVATLEVVSDAGTGAGADAGAARELQPDAPAIDLFSALPGELSVGQCVELRWAVAGETSSIRILRDGAVLVEGAARSGSGTDCPTEPGTVRYRLVAQNAAGASDEAAAEVRVGMPEPTHTPEPPAADATDAAPAAGAAPGAAPLADGGDEILGKELVLVSYRDATGALVAPLAGTRVTALFDAEGGLSGSGGCNGYGGTVTLGKGKITVGSLAVTEMFCGEPIGVMDQETQYLSVLQTAATYTEEAGQLTLLDGAGNPVAIFVAAG